MNDARDDRRVHDPDGLNAGSRPVVHADHFTTPVDRFFTRSHAPVPSVDPAVWRLEVGGLVDRPAAWSMDELLRSFPRRTVAATLVCAGFRRAEFQALGSLNGELPWGLEAAGTGQWTGVPLGDVLRAAGLRDGARHVEFTGLDQVEREGRNFGFGGSIDLTKAMGDEVLLATGLNGAPLPAAQGSPLRVVVPGWIGARSVKWLNRIRVLSEPSENYFFRKAYRVLRRPEPEKPLDVSTGIAMDEIPLNAVIIDPSPGAVVPAGRVTIRGWAIGAGGSPIRDVEISANGREWVRAKTSAGGDGWTWTFWEAGLDLEPGPHTLVVRATDATGIPQPEDLDTAANVKGYGNNARHRVEIVAE